MQFQIDCGSLVVSIYIVVINLRPILKLNLGANCRFFVPKLIFHCSGNLLFASEINLERFHEFNNILI